MTSTGNKPEQAATRRMPQLDRRKRDARGRYLSAPAILHYGFRPFFLLASLHAVLALPFWLWNFASGSQAIGPFPGMDWHAHEMLFGYLGAVIAGFLLTAIPNWTGRLPLSGWPLAVLVLLWLAGRIACASVGNVAMAMILDLLFPAAFLAAILREILAGRNWRNLPVAIVFSMFLLANLMHHLQAAGILGGEHALRLALGAAALLIALIGGRVTPSFTRNWLVKRGENVLPASLGRLDQAALATCAIALVLWVIWPDATASAGLLVLAGLLLFARLLRWRGFTTVREPILLILHVGYGWLAAAMVLLGLSIMAPGTFPSASAYHALSAGAVGVMTLAVMTRATLGHTGHEIRADRVTQLIYLAVNAGALIRVAAPWLGGAAYAGWIIAGGLLWSLAFALFALHYGPLLVSPRNDRRAS